MCLACGHTSDPVSGCKLRNCLLWLNLCRPALICAHFLGQSWQQRCPLLPSSRRCFLCLFHYLFICLWASLKSNFISFGWLGLFFWQDGMLLLTSRCGVRRVCWVWILARECVKPVTLFLIGRALISPSRRDWPGSRLTLPSWLAGAGRALAGRRPDETLYSYLCEDIDWHNVITSSLP